MWNWRHVSNHRNLHPKRIERPNRRFASWSRAFNTDLQILDAIFNSYFSSSLSSYLCCKWCTFARTFKSCPSRSCPCQSIALTVSNRNNRIIKRCVNMSNAFSDVLFYFFANLRCSCSNDVSNPYSYFLPAIALRGPLRVRALVRVRWPRTGKPLRCRRPR